MAMLPTTEVKTTVDVKYAADTNSKLSAYTVSINAKNEATVENYLALGEEIAFLVDAEERPVDSYSLTITETQKLDPTAPDEY